MSAAVLYLALLVSGVTPAETAFAVTLSAAPDTVSTAAWRHWYWRMQYRPYFAKIHAKMPRPAILHDSETVQAGPI